MKESEIDKHTIFTYSRDEFLAEFDLVIDGKQHPLNDPMRPLGKEADHVVRRSDGKKFILAPYQPRDCFKTGDIVLAEFNE